MCVLCANILMLEISNGWIFAVLNEKPFERNILSDANHWMKEKAVRHLATLWSVYEVEPTSGINNLLTIKVYL